MLLLEFKYTSRLSLGFCFCCKDSHIFNEIIVNFYTFRKRYKNTKKRLIKLDAFINNKVSFQLLITFHIAKPVKYFFILVAFNLFVTIGVQFTPKKIAVNPDVMFRVTL